MVEDNQRSAAHRNWGGQTDSHRHPPLHRALCRSYTMTTKKWSPWSDSHRRIRVYETRPVAAEAQGRKKFEIRNSKLEAMTKADTQFTRSQSLHGPRFGLVVNFGFRDSDLKLALSRGFAPRTSAFAE